MKINNIIIQKATGCKKNIVDDNELERVITSFIDVFQVSKLELDTIKYEVSYDSDSETLEIYYKGSEEE